MNDGYKLVAGPLTILLAAVIFLVFYLRNRKKGWTAIYYAVAIFALWSVYTTVVHTILPFPWTGTPYGPCGSSTAYQPIQWNPIASVREGIQGKGLGSYLLDISWIWRSGIVLGIVLPIVFPKAKRLRIQILTALGVGGFSVPLSGGFPGGDRYRESCGSLLQSVVLACLWGWHGRLPAYFEGLPRIFGIYESRVIKRRGQTRFRSGLALSVIDR